ncbi:ABC transporter ATP-binding protein [Marinobacter caseinilyticus]|uniref:ABC transporter ATP-binding protein n=1 Tax=Marinobacter caseinilyticus TaxID=2692195 RepID=UPI001409B6B6|nr:ATP-binding cassette domain-containing protein [Marinobacter caseinilyticus]
MSAFLEVHQLDVAVDTTPILSNLSLGFVEGEVTALLGHNGSGKSTLLKVLARQLQPTRGHVTLQGRGFADTDTRAFARVVGYLPQHPPATDGLTVTELVALGRYPWHGALGRYCQQDHELVAQAITDTGLWAFRHRSVDTLSGGERQRAWLAMLLAQQTQCLLLDEPISALDVGHQVATLRLIHQLAQKRALTVILVLHDVDLAARFCDRLVALRRDASGGQVIADGSPARIMNADTLERIYRVPMGILERAPGLWVSYVH